MSHAVRRTGWLVLVGALAVAGCAPANDDPAASTALRDLAARLDAIDARLRDVEEGISGITGVSERLDRLDGRIEKAAKSSLELYDDTIDQILQLRDHVTLQFGRIREKSEKDRFRELAAKDREALVAMLAEGGIVVDLAASTIRVRGAICQTEAIVEFLGVGEGGKDHESILYLHCVPSLLNAAFLSLGLEPGTPFHIEPKGPDSAPGGIAYGPEEKTLLYYPPTGPSVLIYVEWDREGSKVRRRAEDLIRNRITGETMKREGWVYIGSRFAPDDRTGEDLYVADVTRDMISIWHSYRGNTILDSPLPEAMDDDVFLPDKDALPPRGTEIEIVFSIDPLEE